MQARICKGVNSPDVYAVTPFGCWKFATMQDADDYAYKWDLPRTAMGNAIIEVDEHVGWFGPRLDV